MVSSLWRPLCLLLLVLSLASELEGRRGGGSSSRGSSSSRSSSRGFSSSKSSSGKSWFGGSKSSSSRSSSSSWFGSSARRSGGGFKSSGSSGSTGSRYLWSSSNPRPSLSHSTVSRGIFTPSAGGYFGSSANCGLGGCGGMHTYSVYHYYPRTHYYATHRRTSTTTPSPIGPKANEVATALLSNETSIYGGEEGGNGTDVMEIADPAKPLLIQDLAFFWDTQYLPAKGTKGCANFTPANANSSISFCEVDEMPRCKRNLTELPQYLPETLFFPDGTAPSHLAWLCPTDTGCCEWECCHEAEGWSWWIYFWMLVFFVLGSLYVAKACRHCSEHQQRRREYLEERERAPLSST